jgi:hypothetical protein
LRLTRNEVESGEDDTANGDIEQLVPSGTAVTIKTNLLKHDALVRITTLVREDVRKHSTTLAEVSTIGGDTGRHGIATAHADPKDDTEYGKVEDSIVGGQFAW